MLATLKFMIKLLLNPSKLMEEHQNDQWEIDFRGNIKENKKKDIK